MDREMTSNVANTTTPAEAPAPTPTAPSRERILENFESTRYPYPHPMARKRYCRRALDLIRARISGR